MDRISIVSDASLSLRAQCEQALKVNCRHPTVYCEYLHHICMVMKGLSRPFYVPTDAKTDANHKRFRILNYLHRFKMFIKNPYLLREHEDPT